MTSNKQYMFSLIKNFSSHISKKLLLVAIIVVAGAIVAIGLSLTSKVYKNDSSKPALYSSYSSDATKTNSSMPTISAANIQPIKHATIALIQLKPSVNAENLSDKVTVNGQNIAVPTNGSISKTINSPDGTSSTVNIYSSNNSSGGVSAYSSSSNLTINMHSSSSVTSN